MKQEPLSKSLTPVWEAGPPDRRKKRRCAAVPFLFMHS